MGGFCLHAIEGGGVAFALKSECTGGGNVELAAEHAEDHVRGAGEYGVGVLGAAEMGQGAVRRIDMPNPGNCQF